MNKSSKITALLLVLILVLSLTACSGGSDDDYDSDHGESYYDNEDEESSVVLAAELSGTWSSLTSITKPTATKLFMVEAERASAEFTTVAP